MRQDVSESPMQQLDESGVGPYLRASREALGASLEDAAQLTRISKSYIDALEREDFDRLPNPAYCKGFLRLYATYLGLSGDDVVARFERITSPAQTQPEPQKIQDRGDAESAGKRFMKHRWVLPLLLVAVVLVMSILIDTNQRTPLNRPDSRPSALPVVRPIPVQPLLTSLQKLQVPTPVPVDISRELPAKTSPVPLGGVAQAEGLILRLKVNQDSWLNVDIDGRLSQQYELKAGDMIEWKAESVITLDIGNAGGVEGDLNGKALSPFGQVGKKAHVILRPEGASAQ
jgi:cytoskeleton protein RodZ